MCQHNKEDFWKVKKPRFNVKTALSYQKKKSSFYCVSTLAKVVLVKRIRVHKQIKLTDKLNWNYSLPVNCKLVVFKKILFNSKIFKIFTLKKKKTLWSAFAKNFLQIQKIFHECRSCVCICYACLRRWYIKFENSESNSEYEE